MPGTFASQPHPAALSAASTQASGSTHGNLVIGFVGGVVVLGMLAVLAHRLLIQSKAADSDDLSMTRPVLALVLVGTVVILAASAMTSGDRQTRNLLVGGVVSLGSAAVAFYFSSKGATEARRDLLKATSGTVVPDLHGKTFPQAQEAISLTSLMLVKPDQVPLTTVKTQHPNAGTIAAAGTSVSLVFEAAATHG